jgi:predicted chitinase
MLISYPVLPASAVHDDEDLYLANILEGHVLPYEGRYPVSTTSTAQGPVHRWHGGIHLFGCGEPIRAIADGTVVACRFAAQRENYEGLGDYDTGFVLLRHETQTGEDTSVVFYSLYMHLANQADLAADRLAQLPTWLRQSPGTAVRRPANQRVWRKDVLGFAGQLYNREAVHFEVFMLNADFDRVWRDSSAITEGNGSDDWFGDAHFVIPVERDFAERHPRAPTTGAHRIDFPGNADFPLPQGQAGQNAEKLYVSVSLQQGNRVAITYRAKEDGTYEQLGRPVVQEGYEYELFRLATALYPDCPSAGLEWLRFGRVLGTDTTNRNENWQLVRYSADAIGYIDLAPRAIAKLSDADFPHWHGWEKRDEGSTTQAADGICDDKPTIALSQARDEPSLRKLRHLVCKAPTEWDNADLATRYARLREPGQPLQDDANWKLFEQHVGKLAFWGDAGMAERSVWHFHPLQFIRHFRRCAWLSQNEFRQLQPSHTVRTGTLKGKPVVFWEPVDKMSPSEKDVPVRNRGPLNKMMRKYGIDSGKRQAAFFGNAIQESQWLTKVAEGSGDQLWYAPWHGRGFLQLTNPGNYCDYWAWRGRAVPSALRNALVAAYNAIYLQAPAKRSNSTLQDSNFPSLTAEMKNWRRHVEGNPMPPPASDAEVAPADSAGFYWVKLQMAKYSDEPHRLDRQVVTTGAGEKVYYRSVAFWRASAAVNLPSALNRTYSPALNGFDSRCSAYGVALAVLTETRFPNADSVPLHWYPEGYTVRRP